MERDDEAKNERGVQIAQELINKEQVTATVGYINTGVALASQRFYQDAKIPVFNNVATGSVITHQFKAPEYPDNYVFRNAARQHPGADDRRGSHHPPRLQESGDPGRLHQLWPARPRGPGKALAAKGIKPVAVEKFNIKDVDMTAQLLKSKEAGAEAVLTYGIGPELAQIANGMAKLGWKVPIIGSWTLSMANYIDNSGANGEARACRRPSSRTRTRPSARLSSTPIWPSSSPRTTASTRRCRRQGYDSIFLLAAAIKQPTPPTARRSAKLENLQTPVEGVVMTYNKPFSHDNHDAITARKW